MKFLPSLKSLFTSKPSNSTQSAEASGNQNIIIQGTIHNHFGSQDNDLKRDVVAGADAAAAAPHLQPLLGAVDDTDAPEIQRILDYRDVATKGDADTALTLLKGLENEPVYQAGYPALRLHFNIGIVQNNIGETELAVGSLRRAHDFLPESPKAQTALAFSELLENKFSRANQRATTQLAVEGSHQKLAACILFHAAKKLGEVVEVSDHLETLMQNTDVLASYLDYVRLCVPEEYEVKLFEARANEPDDAQIATMWADYILQDMRQNQDFLLGAKMDKGFEEKIKQSADILRFDLEKSLEERPPNKLLLASQANNAAVALRLTGEAELASTLISKVVSRHSELESDLAQVRAVLCLQQDKDQEALRSC